jgi:cytochrome b subunit of formate dehydrogenase
MRLNRFTFFQRLFHLLLMISFLVQAATGVGRMYVETNFGKILLIPFGSFSNALAWHKVVGIFMLLLFGVHLLYILIVVLKFKTVLGPDSIIPNRADIQMVVSHLKWMLGRAKMPSFERWGYWEKFDYWAVFWGMFILGGTGLVLYEPITTSMILPGWIINVAFWVHRIEAVLAMAHVFLIHFAIAHLRRHNFPMDRAMFAGGTDLHSAKKERTAWITRLDHERRLNNLTSKDASLPSIISSYILGFSAILLGLYILVGGIINFPNVTW